MTIPDTMLCLILSIVLCSTPTISLSNSDDLLPLQNTTKVGESLPIDPRFGFEIDCGQSNLPGISVLMNAVHAMTDLALEDFDEPLVPIPYSLPNFPEVTITPKATARGGAIQTRFIVWGLYQSIVAMTQRKKFRTAVITLRWEAGIVGYISITGHNGRIFMGESNHTESLLRRSRIRASNGIDPIAQDSSNATNISNHPILNVSFVPVGLALAGSDVLITVLYALAYVAPYPSAQAAAGFILRPSDAEKMCLAMLGTATTPFFQYRWVIETLAKIPLYMLYQGRFSGATFTMSIAGVEVGQGQMFKES